MQVTWKIEWMKCLPKVDSIDDYVVQCGWRATGVQDQYNSSIYSSCSFAIPEDTSGSFTPYDQLTEDQVLGWCWVNGVDKDATESALQKMIDDQINPPLVMPPLPWAAPPTSLELGQVHSANTAN